jgi:SPP1 gp7 family putative phage head morphogenesis protein
VSIGAVTTPLVVQLVGQFQADLTAAEGVQQALMAQRWIGVERALGREIEQAAEAAYRQLRRSGPVKEWQVFELARFKVLQAQAVREISRYLADAEVDIGSGQRAAVRRGVQDALDLINAVVGGRSGVRVTLTNLNAAAVENLAALARAGQPLEELMSLAYGKASQGMAQELINGLAMGLNPRETARRMRVEGLSKGFAHTGMVARDMQLRSYRMAQQQQYQESGVVKSFTRIAAKNGRTCKACLALDGTVYPVDDFMPLHPQDRCALIPNVDGMPRVTFQTGEEWFRSLDKQEQRKIMGPGFHEAWEAGKFEFKDMATCVNNQTWGPSAQVTPLKELIG